MKTFLEPEAGVPFPGEAAWEHVEQVVSEYNGLLESVTDEEISGLERGMRDRSIVFGDRLLCKYLRPNFLTRSQFRYVAAAIKEMMAAIGVVEERALADAGFMDRMGVTEGERALIEIEPGLSRFSYKSRMDTFLTRDGFHFVEYNAESPAGIGYGDMLQDTFMDFRPVRELAERHPVSKAHSRIYVLETLLAAWEEWGGRDRPRIAIVDYLDLPTYSEFLMFESFFRAQGYETVVADPRSLEFRAGRLWAGDFEVDLLYRRVLVNELLDRLDECRAMVDAVKARAVCMVNSFRAKLLHKKLLFALLWEDDVQQHLSTSQRAVVARHVPWTVRVRDARVRYQDTDVDLLDFARKEQQRLVLKPNDEYGGRGVVIGWERTAAEWEHALADGLAMPFVLQEKVPVARGDFPDLGRNPGTRIVDLDPFIFGDRVTGCLTRLSDTSLCNVTSGGGQVPTFILED